jgi:hypothetical protein
MVETVDRHVTAAWMDLITGASAEAEQLRQAVAQRWTPASAPPPYWVRLNAELRELTARLQDADDAFYVRGDLDASRHTVIVERLAVKMHQIEDAVRVAEPVFNTAPLRDRDYIKRRWDEHAAAARRALLRLAWSEISLVKAAHRGGPFGDGRIIYHPYAATDAREPWPQLLYGPAT